MLAFKIVIKPILKILTWILYIVTLVSAYGGYFNPDWWTLPALGVLFFPYLALLTLLASIAWFLSKKIITGAIGVGVLMACGPTFPEAFPMRLGNTPSEQRRTFRMVTFNCLHLEDIRQPGLDRNRSLDFLIHSGADFICLQELYAFTGWELDNKYKSQVQELLAEYPYYSKDGSREVEFLSKFPFEQLTVKLGEEVKYGSCAAYRLDIDGRELTVINVHLPSYMLSDDERNILTEAKNQQGVKKSIKEFEGSIYKKMQKAFSQRAMVSKAIAEFAEKTEGNVIVCGDFNDVPGSWTYRNFTKRGFEDAYAQTGFGHLITYNQHLMYFHIDQILYKGDLVPLYVKKERMNASDHYPLIAEFEFI